MLLMILDPMRGAADVEGPLGTITLVMLASVCSWLTWELWRRTRQWNGLSKGLTLLIGGLAVLLWWAVIVQVWDGPDTVRVRLALEAVLVPIGLYAIWQLRKLPPLPAGRSWRWHPRKRG